MLTRAGRGAESLNEITHDRPAPARCKIPRNVLASKRSLDTVWRLGVDERNRQSADPVRTGYRKHRSGSGHNVCETGHELIVFQKTKRNLPREAKGDRRIINPIHARGDHGRKIECALRRDREGQRGRSRTSGDGGELGKGRMCNFCGFWAVM